jgi:hypothetical protein
MQLRYIDLLRPQRVEHIGELLTMSLRHIQQQTFLAADDAVPPAGAFEHFFADLITSVPRSLDAQ